MPIGIYRTGRYYACICDRLFTQLRVNEGDNSKTHRRRKGILHPFTLILLKLPHSVNVYGTKYSVLRNIFIKN